MIVIVTIIVFVALSSTNGESSSATSTIHLLRKDLLNGYDVNARPVRNHLNRTVVSIDLTPVHITDVNENRGILILEGWVYMAWYDEHLKWDPKKYSNLDHVHLSEKEVWKPDITILEGRGNQNSPWNSLSVEVNSSGYVEWMPSATFQVYCGDFDYENYPEDTQTCSITLGCWTQTIENIDLKIKEESRYHSSSLLDFSFQNPHWELKNITAVKENKTADMLEDVIEYALVEFEMEIIRMNVRHSALVAVPETVARVLILCMFWVTNATRKFLLGCTSLLILSAIAVGITTTLPSPAAATAALFEVSAAMSVCITALIVEIVIAGFSDCTLGLPTWLENMAQSSVCRFLSLCQVPKKSSKEDRQSVIPCEEEQKTFWPVIAVIFDRIAFTIFAIILIAL